MNAVSPFSESAGLVHVCLIGLGVAAGCCLCALMANSLRDLVAAGFAVAYRPLEVMRQSSRTALTGLRAWMRSQIENESERKGEGAIYYVIGALFYTLFTAVFLFCDIGVFCLIAAAMGLGEGDFPFHLPADTGTMTAMALVAASLFWGALFFDLVGVTRLAPWRKALSPAWRKAVMGVCIFGFLLSVAIGSAMAYWRGWVVSFEMTEANAAVSATVDSAEGTPAESFPGGIDLGAENTLAAPEAAVTSAMPMPPLWLIPASLVGLAVLSFTSTAFSMVSLSLMLKFVFLLAILLAGVVPLAVCSGILTLLTLVVDAVFNLVRRAVDFIVEIGDLIMRPFGRHPSTADARPGAASATPQPESASSPGPEPSEAGFNPFGPRKE